MKLQQILIFLGYTVIKNNNYYILLENDREHQLLFFRSGENNFSIIDLTSLINYDNTERILAMLSPQFIDDEIKEFIYSVQVDNCFDSLKVFSGDDVLALYLKIEGAAEDFRNDYVFKSAFDLKYPNCIILNGTGKDNKKSKNVLFFNNNFYKYLSSTNTNSFKALPSTLTNTEELALTSNPFLFSYAVDNEDPLILFHYQVEFLEIIHIIENQLTIENSKVDTMKFKLCSLTNIKDYFFSINFIVGYMNYTMNHYFNLSFQDNYCVFSYHVHLSELGQHEKYLLLFSKLSSKLNLVLKEKYHIDLKENNKFLSKSLKNDTNSIKQIVFPYKIEYCLLFVTALIDIFSLNNIQLSTDIQINDSEASYTMF
ncbi:MAG: hypothetical protein CVT95_08495 [Bacteroidetes bacterium HGW-Bacteroidetes-12]|nr:MAG: hypothetical protein CVT95_08495 [Bacteroidetes bacterium HGW-Bacteroidetes-12]